MPAQLNPVFHLPHVYSFKELTGVSLSDGFTLAAQSNLLVGLKPYLPVLGSKCMSLSGSIRPDNGGNATLQFSVNPSSLSNPASADVIAAVDTQIVLTDAFAGSATGFYGFLLNIYPDREGYFGLYARSGAISTPVYETTFAFRYGASQGLRLRVANLAGSQTVNFTELSLILS